MRRAKQKIYPEIILDINKLSHDGRGIANIDGKTTFVHGALPGEKVLCKITYQHRRYNEAKTLEVIVPAANRVTPACEHFGVCGGCSMQHAAMDSQLAFKQEVLLEQLQHFGNVTPSEILTPLSGKPLGYRGKARLGVRYVIKKGKVLVGFREKHSNLLADINQCPVLHSSAATLITALNQLVTSLTQYEHIAQIELAVGDNVTALVFRHLTHLSDDDYEKLRQFGKLHNLYIYLQPNPPEVTYKLYPQDGSEQLSYSLPEFNIEMLFHPLMFTQVNSEMNPLMIKQAIQLLDLQPDDEVLDLFCGLGNFTLPIARYAKNVVGIEGSETMVNIAKQNASHNQISNTDFFAANLMKPSESDAWFAKPYHKILLDPPRTGAKEIIPYFAKFDIKKLVYVSCNPATLARDAHELVHQQGFTLKKAGIINMFPHTSHIEAMALFEK
jgi:23S rRNA (uracil1939-C5)-methyltransferase